MSVRKEGKICFLKEIREAKDILFGAFSEKLTKEQKTTKWKSIHEKAIALGLVSASKDYVYTRDTYWQNLKKYTMKKMDNKKQTGSGGGPECKFSEADNIILDIVGRDSPLILGLPSPETWEAEHSPPLIPPPLDQEIEFVDTLPGTSRDSVGHAPSKKRKRDEKEEAKEESELRRRKLKLSVEIMEKESYLKTLEILKMERELGLPPSIYTCNFPEVIIVESNPDVQIINVEDGN